MLHTAPEELRSQATAATRSLGRVVYASEYQAARQPFMDEARDAIREYAAVASSPRRFLLSIAAEYCDADEAELIGHLLDAANAALDGDFSEAASNAEYAVDAVSRIRDEYDAQI